MKKQAVFTKKAPEAVGPYSQGIHIGDLVFTSGQLPHDMETGRLELTDIRKATAYCLQNVASVLEEGGSALDSAVKVTVFLTDMNDFAAMNEVYATFFTNIPPARSCVQVAALPKGISVEIEAIGIVK